MCQKVCQCTLTKNGECGVGRGTCIVSRIVCHTLDDAIVFCSEIAYGECAGHKRGCFSLFHDIKSPLTLIEVSSVVNPR